MKIFIGYVALAMASQLSVICFALAVIWVASSAHAFEQSGIFTDAGKYRIACLDVSATPCPTRFLDKEGPRWPQACIHAGKHYILNMPAALPATYDRCDAR